MKVLVIGGTQFIGRRATERLLERGDEVLLVHRGHTESDLPPCTHLHVDRRDFATIVGAVRDFAPDAIVDTIALSRADVDATLPYLPDVPTVVLSSMDVYRSFERWLADDDRPIAVPHDEDGPLREGRYVYRGKGWDMDDYEKLDVEPAYLARGATVLRLAMVYGPRDPQLREEFVLRRVRAGRGRIPTGSAATLATRSHVDDTASAVLAVLDRPDVAAGEIFNIGELATLSIRGWMRVILATAGHDAELVTVPDRVLPDDLRLTRAIRQHLLVSSNKATDLLGWRPQDPMAAVRDSVRWHLANPPAGASTDFADDDRALGDAEAIRSPVSSSGPWPSPAASPSVS